MTTPTLPTRPLARPRPTVPASRHDRRRRVRPGRPPRTGPGPWERLRTRLSRRWLWAGVTGAAVLIGALVWALWFSPLLSVRDIEVSGADAQTASAVGELAGSADGSPLLRVDTDALAGSLETALPGLASVSVERDWPGTLRIVVVPRVALAVVTVDGTDWLIDREAVRFAQVTERPPGVPVLQVADPGPGDRTTRAALDVLVALETLPADILGRVATVSAESPDSVQLRLSGGRTVIWGSAADSDRKAAIFAALFDQGGSTIDVSSPGAAVVR